ncbi:hypothetical protein [Haloplanus halobius]|uniref:hypothetical protein n=1 Tax=Haloplanus halobius TaxID=2934938 RepID=UPI00200D8B1B|nr:hypothetical protein [Haloplanus sp. XH21]
MLVEDREEFVTALREDVDAGLRVVAEYDADGYDAFYVRDDIRPRLPDVAEELHEDLVLQGIGRDRLEDLFSAGPLHCSVHRFEELTAFHFTAGEFTGLFVSVDSDAPIPLNSFASTCKSRLS